MYNLGCYYTHLVSFYEDDLLPFLLSSIIYSLFIHQSQSVRHRRRYVHIQINVKCRRDGVITPPPPAPAVYIL